MKNAVKILAAVLALSVGSAGYVAREVIGAEEIVDFTVQKNLLDRFAQRFGAAMAKSVGLQVMQHFSGLK